MIKMFLGALENPEINPSLFDDGSLSLLLANVYRIIV